MNRYISRKVLKTVLIIIAVTFVFFWALYGLGESSGFIETGYDVEYLGRTEL